MFMKNNNCQRQESESDYHTSAVWEMLTSAGELQGRLNPRIICIRNIECFIRITQAGGKNIYFFFRQAVDLLPREVKVVFSGQEVNLPKLQYWSDFTLILLWRVFGKFPKKENQNLSQVGAGIPSGSSLSHCAGDENPCRQVLSCSCTFPCSQN